MTRQRVIVAGIIGLMHCAAIGADAEKGTNLRPHWNKGQTSRFRVMQIETTTAQTNVDNETQQTTMEVTAELTWQVTEAGEAGGGTARMTIDRMEMKMTGPSGKTYTVTGEKADEQFVDLKNWIANVQGSPLDIQVSETGDIGSVKGVDAIKRKLGDAGADLDEDYFQEIAMDLAVLIGGPDHAEQGAVWHHKNTGDHRLGKIDYETTYEFAGVEKIEGVDVAMINRTSALHFKPKLDDRPPDAPPVDIRTTENGSTGQILFDLSRHEIVGANSDQVLTIEIKINIAGRNLVRTLREVTNTQWVRIGEE